LGPRFSGRDEAIQVSQVGNGSAELSLFIMNPFDMLQFHKPSEALPEWKRRDASKSSFNTNV